MVHTVEAPYALCVNETDGVGLVVFATELLLDTGDTDDIVTLEDET